MRCTLTYQHIIKMFPCPKRQNPEVYIIHTKKKKKKKQARNPRLNLTQKEKMKNELMSEIGAECPKEAGYVGLLSHLTKYTCQFKVLFKFYF